MLIGDTRLRPVGVRAYAPEGIGAICPAAILVSHNFEKLFHILMSVNILKQVEQEYTWRVVARRAVRGIAISNQGSYERKIN